MIEDVSAPPVDKRLNLAVAEVDPMAVACTSASKGVFADTVKVTDFESLPERLEALTFAV